MIQPIFRSQKFVFRNEVFHYEWLNVGFRLIAGRYDRTAHLVHEKR